MVLNPGPSSAVALRIQTAATLRYETDGLHIDQSEAFLWCLKLATTSSVGPAIAEDPPNAPHASASQVIKMRIPPSVASRLVYRLPTAGTLLDVQQILRRSTRIRANSVTICKAAPPKPLQAGALTTHEKPPRVLAALGGSLRGVCRADGDLRQGRGRERRLRLRHLHPHHRHSLRGGRDPRAHRPVAAAELGLAAKLHLSRPVGARDRILVALLFPRAETWRRGARRPDRQAQRGAGGDLRRRFLRREACAAKLARGRADRGRRDPGGA